MKALNALFSVVPTTDVNGGMSAIADTIMPVPQVTTFTSNFGANGHVGGDWIDFSGSTITITGAKAGSTWEVTANIFYVPGNTGFNHFRAAAVSNCTILTDGQSGYYTQSTQAFLRVLVKITADGSASFKLQDYSSAAGNGLIQAGAGGSGASQMDFVARRVG